jgi:Flp pilus assembly protein TadG
MVNGAPTLEAPATVTHPVREPHRLAMWCRALARRIRQESGTAVVEFALVSIPLFLIVFGIVDFGRALNYYNNLTQLAGQGARAAAVDRNPDGTGPPTATSIQQQLATNYTGSPELKDPANHLFVCIKDVPTQVGDPVTVQATYTFHFIPFIGDAAGVPTLQLKATSTQRAEVTPVDTNGNLTLGYAAGDQNGLACP